MIIRELRTQLGITQGEFAERYNIPFRAIQNWESEVRKPLEYILKLLEARVQSNLIIQKDFRIAKAQSSEKGSTQAA